MFQDHITIRLRYEKFIQGICRTEKVFSLENEEGFATSSSNEFVDEDDNPISMICFWSEKALANSCRKKDWSVYQIVEISLAEFIEDWCVGLSNDELLVGTNFDSNMFGFEVDPLDLILEIIEELKINQTIIELKKYKNIEELESQVKEIIGE